MYGAEIDAGLQAMASQKLGDTPRKTVRVEGILRETAAAIACHVTGHRDPGEGIVRYGRSVRLRKAQRGQIDSLARQHVSAVGITVESPAERQPLSARALAWCWPVWRPRAGRACSVRECLDRCSQSMRSIPHGCRNVSRDAGAPPRGDLLIQLGIHLIGAIVDDRSGVVVSSSIVWRRSIWQRIVRREREPNRVQHAGGNDVAGKLNTPVGAGDRT